MKRKTNGIPQLLLLYYGLLQTLHLLTLAYAGFMIAGGDPAPFPILPPPGGWGEQTMPFLYGLAGTDLIGILLGIIFAYRAVFNKDFNPRLALLSLTIFITSAIVFGAGTFPSGAWSAHPVAYWIMVVLFIPCIPLFFLLIKISSKQ